MGSVGVCGGVGVGVLWAIVGYVQECASAYASARNLSIILRCPRFSGRPPVVLGFHWEAFFFEAVGQIAMRRRARNGSGKWNVCVSGWLAGCLCVCVFVWVVGWIRALWVGEYARARVCVRACESG